MIHVTAEIAVRDDAHEASLVHHAGHAQALAGHLANDILYRRDCRHGRSAVTCVHQLAGTQEPLAKRTARMQRREILLAKSLGDQECHRQRVTERQCRRRAGCWHQVHWARFLGNTAVQCHVRRLSECGGIVAADRNELGAESA